MKFQDQPVASKRVNRRRSCWWWREVAIKHPWNYQFLKHGCLRRLRKLKIGRIKIWCCRCWSLAGPQIARAVHDGSVVARQLECLGALLSIRPRTHGGKAVLVYFELEVLNSFFLFFSFISFVLICFVTSCQLKIVVYFVLGVFSSNGFAAPVFWSNWEALKTVLYVVRYWTELCRARNCDATYVNGAKIYVTCLMRRTASVWLRWSSAAPISTSCRKDVHPMQRLKVAVSKPAPTLNKSMQDV